MEKSVTAALVDEPAVAVFEDPLDLVDHLDDSVIGKWAAEASGS